MQRIPAKTVPGRIADHASEPSPLLKLARRIREEQGAELGHGFDRELQYLTVHSVLHLLGYDHLDEGEEKARMRAREKAIMKELGYDF